MNMKIGILVGRFQPLHKGHIEAIEFAENNSDKLYIIVGSAEKSNQKRNPFTFKERKKMIELAMIDRKLHESITIVPINDANNNTEWILSIKNVIGAYNIIFTNDEVTEKLFNKDETKVINVPLLDRNALSATEVRRRLELDEKWETLVIPTVANYLKEIKAVKRIKSIT